MNKDIYQLLTRLVVTQNFNDQQINSLAHWFIANVPNFRVEAWKSSLFLSHKDTAISLTTTPTTT